MPGYSYAAISIDGGEALGEIHAPDLDSAREQLRIRGLMAERLRELPASGNDSLRTTFKAACDHDRGRPEHRHRPCRPGGADR